MTLITSLLGKHEDEDFAILCADSRKTLSNSKSEQQNEYFDTFPKLFTGNKCAVAIEGLLSSGQTMADYYQIVKDYVAVNPQQSFQDLLTNLCPLVEEKLFFRVY